MSDRSEVEQAPPRQRCISVVPHDPGWAAQAVLHADRVAGILGPSLVTWHHIGSTSIPGIYAKPIIDLLPLVTSVAAVDRLRDQIEAAGYNWYGEYGLPGRRYINLDDPASGDRIVNVHIYAANDADVDRHLAFRDYLCAHQDDAEGYSRVKIRCAAANPTGIDGYMDCKDNFCKQIEARAVAWYQSGQQP